MEKEKEEIAFMLKATSIQWNDKSLPNQDQFWFSAEGLDKLQNKYLTNKYPDLNFWDFSDSTYQEFTDKADKEIVRELLTKKYKQKPIDFNCEDKLLELKDRYYK